MNRLAFCIILLLFSGSTFAEKLYRWIEPDGSITFSPNPPAEGIDFTVVDSASAISESNANEGSSNARSILATSEHSLDADTPLPKPAQPVQIQPATAVAVPKLNYAPDNTGSSQPVQNEAIAADASAPVQQRSTQTVVATDKRQHCNDLSKRVISLERRLRSPLDAEDMDNTVMAMARYQRSYDQYCG